MPVPAAAPPPPPVASLPPLPASVKLNPAVTRVQVVPLATSLTTIPPVSQEEVASVKEWMAADRAYEAIYRDMKTRMGAEFGEMMGPRNVPWWEKGTRDMNASRFLKGREQFDVRYPYRKKERDGVRRKGGRREGIRLPRKLDPEDANRPEQLVPIRLEFDVEHHKMRDTFVWNLNDPVISPEDFAQTVVEDYKLAPTYHGIIVKTIQDQLSDFRAHSANYDGDSWDVAVTEDTLRPGTLEGESAAWWSAWRKRLRTEYGAVRAGRGKGHKRRKVVKEDEDMDAADERPMAVEEFTFDQSAPLHDDMRILIRLDIIVGSVKLDDQFEWDLDNTDASPESFAEIYTKELGLSGEFKTAIAHAIREQVQAYQKSLFLVGRPTDGTPVQDDDLRSSLLPSLSSGARAMDQVQSFTPLLNYLSDGELERNEKDRDKDFNRRRKRNRGGRRGVALPDRDPIRTYRTPSIGFPELDAATLAAAAAATAPVSRRAAAAAASVTIANMVASENGERAYTPSALPAAPLPPPLVIKEKTIKGFFKPPPIDRAVVLRPRAKIPAPVPSTAADVSKFPVPLENDPPPPPTSTVMPPDNRAAKAKRGKDSDIKDKEFADGQRRNMINGVWHCSNCGCPESIAIGRRKGPLGDKSQCGTCGKYWHRHRRPRPVEYNFDLEYHASLKREAELAKTMAKRRGGAAALRAQGGTVPATPAETSGLQTPQDSGEGPSRQSPVRDLSPVSDTSSASEPPLADKVKINGTSHAHATPPPPPPPERIEPPPVAVPPAPSAMTPSPVVAPTSIPPPVSTPNPASTTPSVSVPPPVSGPPQPLPLPSEPVVAPAPPPSSTGASPTTGPSAPTPGPPAAAAATPPRTQIWPPQWLSNAMQAMQAKWKNDKFEVILRKVNSASTPEWRIKCLDCPGKLYQPGPDETLSNYEVHLRNRLHRQRVNDRMGNSSNS
ncbi:SNF5-domain-containing protein [Mycena maculata]|uniref:SNF5-domain-containing protein n=1 Tax=Mycena maculata TaxID=230809 RepID=A0AAD7JK44_9AGAR|nr:SNF5-domain-containing protein [Mycena maculata]